MTRPPKLPPIVIAWDAAGEELHDLAGRAWRAGEAPPAEWRRRGLYLCGAAPWARILARYGAPGDTAAGPRVGEPAGATVGKLRIYGGAAWGLSSSPAAAAAELAALVDAVAAEGLPWGATAGGVAGGLVRVEAERAGWAGQLRPRWRGLARDALHQGPMIAGPVRAARECVQLDRREAYLRAMAAPLPDIRRARILRRGTPWGSVLRALAAGGGGIVAAVVDLPGDGPSPLAGPLPVRVRTGTAWPSGQLAGAWTAEVLAAAVAAWPGARVTVAGGWLAPCESVLRPVAERIDRVAYRPLRRALYTRAWGQLAFEGWPEARVIPRPAPDAPGYWTPISMDRALAWEPGGVGYGPEAPPIFRPDLAAAIAGHNLARMVGAVALAGAGAMMALVDALFLTPAAAERVAAADRDGWAVKGTGPIAILAPGVYVHAGRVKAMGAPAWLPSEARLRHAEAATLAADPVAADRLAGGARWRDRPPRAEEIGHHARTAATVLPVRGAPWTPRGWLRHGAEVETDTIAG